MSSLIHSQPPGPADTKDRKLLRIRMDEMWLTYGNEEGGISRIVDIQGRHSLM